MKKLHTDGLLESLDFESVTSQIFQIPKACIPYMCIMTFLHLGKIQSAFQKPNPNMALLATYASMQTLVSKVFYFVSNMIS
jgi:hypothetical protein